MADTDKPDQPDEAAAVTEQVEAERVASEKRERGQVRRGEARKSYPDDAAPPQQVEKQGEMAYSRERLLAESDDFLGVPQHVLAGALFGNDEPYLTRDEAKALVDEFLTRETV